MSLRKLRYLKVKQSELSFAMHYLPNNAVSFDDCSGLLVTFVDVYLSIRFYKNLDAGDNKTYLGLNSTQRTSSVNQLYLDV